MKKKFYFLKEEVEHIDITKFDSIPIIEAMKHMSFTAREIANASLLFNRMIKDRNCSIFLCIAGSTSAAGCMKTYSDIVKYNMADVVVATGASIVDMDFFEALGFMHYKGTHNVDDKELRKMYIDRIYDTFIDEKQLQVCDNTIKKIADRLEARPYSSRQFIKEMGKYLKKNAKKKNSLVEVCYDNDVPIFCPAFSDSSAGLGLVLHQYERIKKHRKYISIDSVADFRELTGIKIKSPVSGLFMIGGGVPKNFAQDTVICAEVLREPVDMHKYAVQITVADVRDGGCSSSTLREATSWGKVNSENEQMVYAEATSVLPSIASYVYHKRDWEKRERKRFSKIFE